MLIRFDPLARGGPNVPTRDELTPKPAAARKLPPSTQQATGALAIGDDILSASRLARVNLADVLPPPPDDLSRYIDLRPKASTRRVNGHRIADQLELAINWRDAPFDARTIRAVLVLHYEGTVSPEEFARGVGDGETGESLGSSLTSIVPATRENLRFMGLADEWSDEHNGDGDVISVKLRDLTALFIDRKAPPNLLATLKPGKTILTALLAIKDSMGKAGTLIRGPFVRPANLDPARLVLDSKQYARVATTAAVKNAQKTGADPLASAGGLQRPPTKADGENYWDVITDLCISQGFIPTVELDQLVIQPPRTMFDRPPEVIGQPNVMRFPTEFRRRIGDTQHRARRMVYGKNLADVKFHKKLARVKTPLVRVIAFDPDARTPAGRRLVVDYPDVKLGALGKNPSTAILPNGDELELEYHVINADQWGIKDKTLMRRIAESAYEFMGRGELGATISTSDLASWSDHPDFDPNDDPDLLDVRAGDPIELLVQAGARGSPYVTVSDLNLLVAKYLGESDFGRAEAFASAEADLVQRGLTPADARVLVRLATSANLPSELRLASACIRFDSGEDGEPDCQIDLDVRDYIRVRADPDLDKPTPEAEREHAPRRTYIRRRHLPEER